MAPDSLVSRVFLTAIAMTGFAANSLLCRAALGSSSIDAFSFTFIRIFSGALSLGLICKAVGVPSKISLKTRTSWISPFALIFYALFFSAAYLRIDAGVGALILFGAVQVTMVTSGILRGVRSKSGEMLGVFIAIVGLGYLTLPGKSAPDPMNALFMAIAGVAWGIYSLRGRNAGSPLAATRDNFVFAVPVALVVALAASAIAAPKFTTKGIFLASISGAITSGLVYSVWYFVLPMLRPTLAAVVQLSVPIIALTASHLWLGEVLSWQLIIASSLVLGGIATVIAAR